MSSPGWYPDPAGQPNQARYWDGRQWSPHLRPLEGAPPPGGPKRRRWIITFVVALVLVLVTLTVVRQRLTDSNANPPASSSPTVSSWNETETPTPSGWDPSSSPDPGGDRPANCNPGANQLGSPPSGARLVNGRLSMPIPSTPGWRGPSPEGRMPRGRDGWGYVFRLPEKLGWASSMTIGMTAFDDYPGAETAAKTMVQCILTSGLYSEVDVTLAEFTSKAIRVGDTPAVEADALVTFDHPQLNTKGSRLRLVIVDTKPQAAYFFAAVPKERDDQIKLVDETTKGLRVEG